jgi:ABC-type antimicrobial peptide transport system permease subunit
VFSEGDVSVARMVINEAFAHQYFPNEDPLGSKVKLAVLDEPYRDAPRDTYFEIVGVVANYKSRDYENPSWQEFPEAFIPYSVQMFSWRTIMARTSVDAASLPKTMEKEVQSVDSGVAIGTSGTLEASLREFYRGPQFELVTLSAFSLVGLVLVVIGVLSVMGYIVSFQTREIGIRMALGAQQRNILRLVLLNGLRLVAAGIFAGLLASYALTRFLVSQIPGVSATAPGHLRSCHGRCSLGRTNCIPTPGAARLPNRSPCRPPLRIMRSTSAGFGRAIKLAVHMPD